MNVFDGVNVVVEQTLDNSPTLYRIDIDEHYHSTKGAVTEAVHVYVKSGLEHHRNMNLRVCEIGFGTGLNALATALLTQKKVEYHAFELYPLPISLCESLSYPRDICTIQAGIEEAVGIALLSDIHNAPWDNLRRVSTRFSIEKHQCNITQGIPLDTATVDVVYFDAFAPEKQPEMWSEGVMREIYRIMAPGGVLTTYCAKGSIRRLFQKIGFKTERIQGPPRGKREILRVVKP